MSLTTAETLLRQYNKNNTKKKPTTENRFGTFVYANPQDAMFDQYSNDKNFNINMWQDAVSVGEQSTYIALLERNKDRILNSEFYDPQYYDYETMMLELYQPFAAVNDTQERFRDVYDPVEDKWVEESLGEMNSQQYIQYQLDQIREARSAEITRGLEQWRKDQLGWLEKTGHSALATIAEFGEGVLVAMTSLIDFVTAVGTLGLVPYASNGFEGNYLDAFVDYFGENGLTAAEKRSVRAALDEYERTHTHFRDIDGNITGVGKYVAGIANSIGMMIPAIIANYFTGGTAALSKMGTATFYASIFGNNMYENATDPSRANSPSWLKITNAVFKTGVEAVIEWSLDKMLGGTIQNQMIGIGGRNIDASFIKGFNKTSGLEYFLKSATQEGLEEFLQDFSTNCVDQFTNLIYEGYGNTGVTFQTLVDSFCIGVLSSMFMSGGRVAFSATSSAIRNAKNPGSGDLLIETENGPQKVTGFNRLRYSQILSDFKQAVNELKHGKISEKKNIGLAQEVYGAVSAISQFYSSFDAERIKNCEMLLNRVVKAEKFAENHERAASILSEKTMKKAMRHEVKKTAQTFAAMTEMTFRSMVGGVALRHAEKLRAAADKKEEVLTAAGVTEARAFIDTDGVRYQKDPKMAELEERLGKKAVDNIEELRKGYEWVITTDGHIAVETDGYLFVSETWLQNYTVSDIYKYLEQTRVLQALTTDKTLAPMVKKLIAFDEKFTGQTDVDAERAMMDLLFNKSVYQAFLLSNGGKNVHEFKHFIFQLHEIIKDLASRSKYHQQLFKGKQAQTRINMLNQIYEQIKETMREPTIKAILNWHFDSQTIGADSVLTQRDREVINKYEQRRRVLANAAKTGKDISAYEHLVEDIIAKADFNDRELELVRKSIAGTATIDEDTEARALLEEADRRMTRYDFEVSPDHSYYLVSADKIVERLKSVDFTKIPESYSNEKQQTISSLAEDINWYVQEAIADAPGYMDSRNLGSEEGLVESTVERIRETFEEYNYDTSKNSDIEFLVENLGHDGSLETLENDVVELTRLLKNSSNITDKTPYDVAMTQLTEIIDDIETFVNEIRHRANIPEKLLDRINFWYERSFDNGLINRGAGVDLNLIAMSGVQLIRDYCSHIEKNTMKHRKKVGLGAFVVPYQIAGLALDGEFTADAQFVTDKLNEFENTYGISARQMIMGDLSGMSMAQRNQLTQDMEVLDVDNVTLFVIKKLEGMLGGKYVITPTRSQYRSDRESLGAKIKLIQSRVDMLSESENISGYDSLVDSIQFIIDGIDSQKKLFMPESLIETLEQWYKPFNVTDQYDSVTFDGKPFWCGSVSLLDGIIEEVHTYKEAASTGFHHSMYFSEEQLDKMSDGDNAFFWVDNGKIEGDWRDEIPAKIINKIREQIVPRKMTVTIGDRLKNLKSKIQIGLDFLITFSEYAESNSHTSNIYDFTIARAIPVETLLSHNILAEDVKTRNAIFKRMFSFENVYSVQDVFERVYDEVSRRAKAYDTLPKVIQEMFSKEELSAMEEELSILKARVEAGEIMTKVYGEFVNTIARGVNPFTGESFYENGTPTSTDEGYYELFYYNMAQQTQVPSRPLSDFIDISAFSTIDLAHVRVYFEDAGEDNAGYASGDKIVIDPEKDGDHFGTLVHEVNHILQMRTNIPGGFNSKTAGAMPDFLAYTANHYPDFVKYTMRKAGYELDIEVLYGEDGNEHISQDYVSELPKYLRSLIAHCGYMLVQGELWARAYMHNGKPVHGFVEIFGTQGNYLLAPDGKTKFKVVYDTSDTKSMSETSSTSDIIAGSALDVAIQKLFKLKALQEKHGYANTSRNTYHSNFTKGSATAMTQKLMSPTVPMISKYTMKLTDIVKNPKQYLAPEILELCKGDYSEGNVFYRIKEYVEANYEGISIDRKDTIGDEYIFVDDNAFDDLLLSTMRTKATSDDKTLARQYGGREVPLSKFYSSQELTRLGVHPKAFVLIASNTKTETRFDAEHRVGAIFIRANENTTDAQIIDKLNHEFRHILQYYNGFETGFTPDFKVSQEMIDDVKKHVPGLFKNETVIRWAKTRYGRDWESGIVQHFVYLTVGGELNAYAFNASELYAKPSFVNKEGGNPTIFMPWYDAKTGEGRYKTEFLAMRADDETESKKATLPRTNKRPKNSGIKVESLDDTDKLKQYIYTQRRDFTAAKAKGTNLQYFVKKGQRNQMDPDLQEFVIATTGHEDKLPPELVNAIKKGILTKQALFKWFRQVKTVNEFTFDLLNKYMFKNNYITSMEELDAMLTVDPSFYWAAAVVLRKEGLALESLLAENDVDKFLSFINSLEGTEWKAKIEKLQTKFDEQWIGDGKGGYKKENIGYSDRVQAYMRVLAMQWFDGTLAGAFYMANAFRKTARLYEEEVRGIASIDATFGNAKGDKELTLADTLTEDDALSGDNSFVGNDILAIYEAETDTGKSQDEMLQELSRAYYERLCKKVGLNPHTASKEKIELIAQKVLGYRRKLANLPIDEISHRYAELTNSQITDTQPQGIFNTQSQTGNRRQSIVDRIKRRGDYILNAVQKGKIVFTDLPKEIQDMFTFESATTESGKKTQTRVLKPEVYSVGKGRKKLPGATDTTRRFAYPLKHNITEGNEAFRHDTIKIEANLEMLDNIVYAIKQMVGKKKGNGDIKKLHARGERASRSLVDAMRKQKTPPPKEGMRTTEFKVTTKKKKRTSDTPNIFNIVSAIDMPYQLHKIFDTSFEDMANTEVQFASRDESGQLYDKSQFKPGEFDSRVKHEVSNWDAFYEANRDALLSLTRNDILDIVEFFQRGMMTVDGPTNKLAAFEIFLLGYIVDGARRNFNNWNFSDAEIEMIEKLYEQKASAHGSGLQAVQQMLKVVDPMKKVRQRMFDEWDAISDDDKDKLIKAVDDLQRETDADTRLKKAEAVQKMLKEFGQRQMAVDKNKYPRWSKAWWGRAWSKVKSYRHTAMLSGPTTWIRNVISNVIVTGFNKTSDAIGRIIFSKKGYRKEQWDLAGTKISTEAKTFIDTYILNNPVFTPLYDMSSKYDSRQSKKVADERGLLVTLIAKAYEKQYAQDHRFDSGVMNNIAKFIDKMISDKKFVKFATVRYFGKILTIEAERGNVDLSQGLSSEAMDLFAESVILANQEYIHKRSFCADFLDGIREKHPKTYEALTIWQPFLNSSFNWFVESLKYTPIGLANSIIRACRLEKQIANLNERRAKGEMVTDSKAAEFFVRRDIGKGILGLMLSAFGAMLASSGRIRIDEDDEKFYMYIDEDIKLDITNLFGSSSVLVGASIAQLWIEQKDGDVASFEDMLSLLTDTMLDGFFATDLLERHKWGGTWEDLLTETESVMRSFVPQMWQTIIACTNQEKIRYSAGFKGMWERWLNAFVLTQPFGNRKINPYTGEVEDKYSLPILGGLLQKGILGPKIYWVEVSEYERMCRELGINKSELTGELTVGDKKYELDRLALNEKYGELNKESLIKIKSQKHKVEMPDGTFKTLSWDKMSDEQRTRVISRTMTQNAEIVKVYMWTQVMDKKFYTSNSLWQILRQLGIIKNVYKGDKGFAE